MTTTSVRPDLTVRPLRDDENAAVRAIATRAFDRFDRSLYSTRGREVLVAVDRDDRILGAVVLHATEPGALGRLGIVHFIFADPEVPVRGIGTALQEAADARFAELGCVETSARIDATNSASQALHRSGGYRRTTVSEQVRRWSWRLPLRWWQAGTGFDPGMELWLRPAPQAQRTPRLWRGLAATATLNLLLLLVVTWRAPRAEVGTLALLGTLTATVVLLLGAREAAIRVVARQQGRTLGHVPWTNALGLSGLLAAGLGVWLPLTGSSVPRRAGWRHDHDIAPLGRAHLAGALVVAGLAWTALLIEPSTSWLAWPEVRRAAVMLALLDLVPAFSPMIGSAARHVRRWSTRAWVVLAILGIGPLVLTLR